MSVLGCTFPINLNEMSSARSLVVRGLMSCDVEYSHDRNPPNTAMIVNSHKLTVYSSLVCKDSFHRFVMCSK